MLIGLMDKKRGFHDMKIAEYYATRGKLTKLNAVHSANTALTYATEEGHLDIVQALLAAGGDKNGTDSYGYPPLIGPLGMVVWRS